MIQLSIIYPKKENAKFDWDYYLNIHIPLSIKLHGGALKGVSIVKELDTGIEDLPASYTALTSMLFESVNSFFEAFAPHSEILREDMKNYTDIEPIIQFSEIVMQHI